MEIATADYRSPPRAIGHGDVVLYHFEPGLIHDKTRFLRHLRDVRAQGGKIAFTCHFFTADVEAEYRGFVDLFVLHRPYAIAGRSVQIPLGCPVYHPPSRDELRAKLGVGPNEVLLTTVGFLTRWKRIPEVVGELVARLPAGVRVHVQTPWPFNPVGADVAAEDAALRQVRGAHVSTAFLPERELLDLVHASDLGFVFHGIDTGSVSAATKQFVSARTPLIVTGSTHASDLQGVLRVPGFSVEAFVNEVVRVAQDGPYRERMREAMRAEYERINMDVVAKRYVEELGRLV